MTKNLIIIAVILGFFASVVFLDVPIVQGILNSKNEIENKQKLLIEKEDLIKTVEALMEKYKNSEEILKNLDVILPGNSDVPDLLVQIEALANAGGMIISDMNILLTEEKKSSKAGTVRSGDAVQEQASSDYKTITINLIIGGNYAAFKSLLQAIEKNMRLIDIDSVTFSGKSQGLESLFNFDMVLKTYYYAN